MNFIKNGSTVEILNSGLKGTTTGTCVRGINNESVMYDVTWFSGGAIHEKWLYDYQVREYKDTTKKAGMVDYETLPTITD